MVQDSGRESLKPVDSARARDDFDNRTTLVQQGGRLKRALTSPDDDHFLVGKPTEVAVLGGVRGQRRREAFEFWWTPGERTDACSNDDTARVDCVAICESDSEAGGIGFNSRDPPSIDVRYDLTLIP